MEQLKLLWELQEVEQKIKQHEKELQHLSSVEEYRRKKREFATLEQELDQKTRRFEEQQKELRRKESEIEQLNASVKELNDRLYSGEIASAKELESLEKKIASLKANIADLEEESLYLMDTLEEEEGALQRSQEKKEQEKAALQQAKKKAARDTEALKAKLEELNSSKNELENKIEEGLLQKYRQMSRRTGGRCISLVKEGFCGICNVSLPSSFRARILTPGEMVYCENCGSLLVAGD